MNQNIEHFFDYYGLTEDQRNDLLSGEFYEFEEGFISVQDKGGYYQLSCNSVNRPWSKPFILRLVNLVNSGRRMVAFSDDPDVISLAMKNGARLVDKNVVAWNV